MRAPTDLSTFRMSKQNNPPPARKNKWTENAEVKMITNQRYTSFECPSRFCVLLSDLNSENVTLQTWACNLCQEGARNRQQNKVFGGILRNTLKNSHCKSVPLLKPLKTRSFVPPSWGNAHEAWKHSKLPRAPQHRIFQGFSWARHPKKDEVHFWKTLPNISSAFPRQTIFQNADFGNAPQPPHDYLGKWLWKLPAPAHLRNTAGTGIQSLWRQQAHSCTLERAHSCILICQKKGHLVVPSAYMWTWWVILWSALFRDFFWGANSWSTFAG